MQSLLDCVFSFRSLQRILGCSSETLQKLESRLPLALRAVACTACIRRLRTRRRLLSTGEGHRHRGGRLSGEMKIAARPCESLDCPIPRMALDGSPDVPDRCRRDHSLGVSCHPDPDQHDARMGSDRLRKGDTPVGHVAPIIRRRAFADRATKL